MNYSDKYELVKFASSISEEEISKSAASLLSKLQGLGSKGKDLAKSYFDVVSGKNVKDKFLSRLMDEWYAEEKLKTDKARLATLLGVSLVPTSLAARW